MPSVTELSPERSCVLAATVVILLLAPAAALGAWGGLALAARVPEPVRPGEKADLLEPAAGAASIGEPSVEEPPSGEPAAHKGEPQ